MGPGARVALTGKRDRPLQSFHAVAIVACDKLGFYFLYLDSIPQWSSGYYKRTKYTAMGYIVSSDGLIAPSMDGQPAVVIWGPYSVAGGSGYFCLR